jgi:hypothetical protein
MTAPARRRRGLAGLRGRYRRTPLLLTVLAIGLVGGLVVFGLTTRPGASAPFPVAVPEAYAGTTYAFDGVLCVDATRVAAEVREVTVEQAPGSVTAVVLPPEGARTSLGFPADDEGASPEGLVVDPGTDGCVLRVLVTPEEQGPVRAGTVRVALRYGPFGLLPRTVELRPQLTLDVTQTGEDPRGDLS